MNTSSIQFTRLVLAATFLAVSTGCVYVHPAKRNPVWAGTYTRAETFPAEQRLVDALLSDPTFTQHYAAKMVQKGGAIPMVQVSFIDNLSTKRNASLLGAVRRDLETALRTSGRFVLSGDPDACDYILRGEYRDIVDGRRVTHQLAIQLHDTAADIDVWTGADEIAKKYYCSQDYYRCSRRLQCRQGCMNCRRRFGRRHGLR